MVSLNIGTKMQMAHRSRAMAAVIGMKMVK